MTTLSLNSALGGRARSRLRAAGIHFCASLVVAALAALLVFLVWYPYPYREISGGRELFVLLVSVDVVLGPLITLVIFNTGKPKKELWRDLAIVIAIQLAALGYGLWTVFVARPVHLVFEIDRLRVVHAVDIEDSLLPKKPPEIVAKPLTGPTLLSVRPFKDASENFDVTFAALQGADIGARPDMWQSWEAGKPQLLKEAKPVNQLRARSPADAAVIDAAQQEIPADRRAALVYLPVASRKAFWTALIDPATTEILAFVPIDPY